MYPHCRTLLASLLVNFGTDPTLASSAPSLAAVAQPVDPRLPGLRRSVQATRSLASLRRKSIGAQCKFQVDMLLDLIAKTQTHFVFCLLPQHNAGLCQLKQQYAIGSGNTGGELSNTPSGLHYTNYRSAYYLTIALL